MAKKRRTRRTAAQRAATAKMLAANRRRRKPSTKYASNPIRRRRRSVSLTGKHVRRIRRRRNPIRIPGLGGIGSLLMPAVVGAAGAIAVDAAMAYVPLPASLKSGNMANVTRLGAAVLLGTVGRKLLGRHATTAAIGAMTVTAYQVGKNLMAQSGLSLGYYGAGLSLPAPAATSAPAPAALNGMGAYLPNYGSNRGFSMSNGIGEYIR